MNKFKIGDICIIQNIPDGRLGQHFNGEEVTITGLPGCDFYQPTMYSISGNIDKELPAGLPCWLAPEAYLRLKRDETGLDATLTPQQLNIKVKWEDCAWQPRELVDV
jgi:hypothetical protein